MSSDPSDIWSPHQGTTTFTFSPTRQSYSSQSDIQQFSSDEEDPAEHNRRVLVSPSPSYTQENFDDEFSDDNSLDEVHATLSNLDEELDDTEQALTEWSGSYTSGRPTNSTATRTFAGSYSGTYTGSPSFVSLPTFSPRSPFPQTVDPQARLSRITEVTEESRPTSIATATSATNFLRPANPTPEGLRRSALLGGGSASHSRTSLESGPDRTLPLPGRLNELRAVFESQNPAGPSTVSTPGFRSSSPMFGTTTLTSATGHGYGSTSYASRPSSPSKFGTGSSGSYTGPSLLSPPLTRPTTTSGFRSTASATTRTGTETVISSSYTATPPYTATSSYTATPSYTVTPSYAATVTPSNFSGTNTNTWSNVNTQTRTGYTTPNPTSNTYSDAGTFTRTSVTPPSGLRRPQTSPRSPLASVRNIVALWKERTPAAARPGDKSAAESVSSISPPADTDGLRGVRRRVEGARARLREARAVSNPPVTARLEGDSTDNGRNNSFPPGIDMSELTGYAKSKDPPIHIGLLWYLNVHASPPYRWQRCQALLYPHMLLLSWLAPGGGRGIVALDLLNCTKAQSAYSPLHPLARDDVGTLAASQQTNDRDGQSLMDMLVPFQMLYADGVERLAAESLLERQKWVNRIMDSIHPPILVPDSASVTRSPTGSIRTILSIDSNSSQSSNGSRSTVFVPPLSTLPDISDFQSNSSAVSRQSSLASSYHTQTVDDTAIQNQEYVYRGDPRVITPSRGNSMRRSGSMTDLDEAFKMAISRARGAGPFGGSPVTISSGSTLGKEIFVTPPPSIGRLSGSDRARSDVSDERFFSAGSTDGTRSNVSSTYFSQNSMTSFSDLRTATNLRSDTLTALTTADSETQVPTTTFTPSSYRLTESGSFSSGDSDISFADSPSTLSRAREIRRRVAGTSRSHSSGYQTEASQSDNSSDKENDESMSGGRTPTGSYTYTPISGSASLSGSERGNGSGSYTDSRSRTPTGSERSVRSGSGSFASSGSYPGNGSGSYTPRSGSSRSDSFTPASESFTPASGSFTPASGSYTPSSGSYTPGSGGYTSGSGSYTLQAEVSSSSGVGGVPLSSSETGYDVCPSSDFTDLTRFTTESETVTPITRSSDTLSDVASEKYVTASMGSTEFLTAVVQSSRASITSFESFPTIPASDSEYATANSSSSTDYHTAFEPAKSPRFSPESVYITADTFSSELGDIPSEVSTPTLSSLRLGSEPDDTRSVVRIPSVVPTIKSPTISLMSELLPEEIPLPASLHSPSIRTPSIDSRSPPSPFVHVSPPVAASVLSDLLPEEVPIPASLHSPSTRTPSIDSRSTPSPFVHISSPVVAASILSEILPEEVPLPTSLHSPSTRTPSIESRSPPSPFVHVSPPVAAASVLSELLPEEVPLPASVGSPSIVSELFPEEIPLPASVRVTDRPLPPLPPPPAAATASSGSSVPLSPLPSTSSGPLPPLPAAALSSGSSVPLSPLPSTSSTPLAPPVLSSGSSVPLSPLPSTSSAPLPSPPVFTVSSVSVVSVPSVPSVPLSLSPSLSPSAATVPFIPSPSSIPAQPSASLPSISSLSSPFVVQPSPSSPSPSLPPVPLSTPSASLALSPTPSPLESSVEVSDARTPSSFHMPMTSLSSPDDDEDAADEHTVSLSLLPTLPDSSLGSTSVITPTSLAFSSVSTASTLPPSTLVISPSSVLSPESMSTISSSRSLSSFTQTSSSVLPLGPQPWASVSNFSYDSSVLQPSPSVQSIALQEVDVSFETSFLRPSGSASSVDRMSTIPGSPSPLTSAPPQSPLQPLTSVPVLPSSVSSSTDVATPTSISLSTESSSSLGRTLSTYSSSSFVSQTSLNSSVFDSRSLQFEDLEEAEPEVEQEEPQVPELHTESALSISTEPSLLSSLPSSVSTPRPVPISVSSQSASPISVPSLRSSSTTMPSLHSSTSTTMPVSSLSSPSMPMPSHPSSPLPPPSMPVSLLSSSMMTPEASLAVSLTTPHGSGDTEQSSLRTVPSVSTVTERDLGRDIDRLADELRTYDNTRGLENQDVIDNVRALRQELQDLADFLHRTPSPPTPVVRVEPQETREDTPIPRRSVHMVDASVGRTTSISSVSQFLPLPPAAPASLSRATSNASSFNSYLSSHHSDDYLYEEPIYALSSPLSTFDDDVGSTVDSPTSSGSSSLGTSSPEWLPTEPIPEVTAPSVPQESPSPRERELPLPPESPLVEPSLEHLPRDPAVPELPGSPQSSSTQPSPHLPREPTISELRDTSESSEASTVRPSVDLLQSIGNIRDQLRALENGQDAAHDLLMSLLRGQEDPTVELADRLRRIEDLVQALVDQGHPRGPEITQDVPPAAFEPASSFEPEGSLSDSESLGYLGSILGRLTRDGPYMPIPVTARQGPTMVQQLDEILSSGHQIPVVGVDQPPNVDPFVYRPVERGQRARSESPGSFSVPLRPVTVPLVVPPATYSTGRPQRPSRYPHGRRGTSEEDIEPVFQRPPQQPPVGTQAPQEPQIDRIVQQPSQQQAIRRSIPTPGPVIPDNLYERAPTAPASFGGTGRREPQTWYLPDQRRQQPPRPTISADIPSQQAAGQPQEPNIQRQYVPMPLGPTTVQLPPVFESLMEILRENRLAQLATVDQQRELMRYMRGLNEWLERDVYDRQSELRGVVARVEQLSHDIRGIRAQEGTSSSGSDDTSTVYQPGPSFPQPQLDPRFPQPSLRYPPVIPPVVPETTGFQGPFIPPQAFPHPPGFPQPQAFAQPITVTTLPPRIPPFLPDRPGPLGPVPDRRTSEGGSVFIPPDMSPASRHSTGEPRPTYPMSPPPIPRPYPTDLGEVVHIPPSPSSSSGSSTDTYRRGGSRRDSRRADSRVGEPRRGGESYESRPTSPFESRHPRTSSPRRSSRPASGPLVVTNLSEVPEVVSDPHGRHSVSPESSHYEPRRDSPQFQPQFQPQPQPQPPQQPAPMTITILPSPSPGEPQMPMTPMGMVPSGASMGMAPSGVPMVPTGGQIPSVMRPTTPMFMRPSSRSSSRSSGVPVVMAPSGMPMGMAPSGAPMGMVPSGVPMGMAPTGGIMMQPTASPMQPSRRPSRRRSSSRSSDVPFVMAPSGMPMGMAPSGMPMGMAPTGMPMGMAPTGMPMGMAPSGMPMVPPVFGQPSSRSSSRSHRTQHRQTPPASQPVIINTEQRRTPPHVQPAQQQPQVVVVSDRHSPSRHTERHDSPPVILHQPAPYPAPMGFPQQGMLPMGMDPGMVGPGPLVVAGSPRFSRSRSRSPRRDAPYVVPVQQPTGRTWTPRYDDDYDSRSPHRPPRRRPHHDSSRSSYDRRRHDSSRSSPRRRHSRSSSYSSRSPSRLHYPPPTGVGPSGVVPMLPTHYPTPSHYPSQHPSQYPGQHPSQYPDQYPGHYPSRLRRSQSSSPSPRRPPRAGATYEYPYSSSRDHRTGDGSPSRYESRRPQTTSPSPWHPPPVDPTRGRPYSPSRRYRPERSSSDSSLVPVPYDPAFRRPQSTSFSPDRPPRGEVIRPRPYSPSRRHRPERPGSDGSPVPVPYESRRPQSPFSPERLPRVEVTRGRPYSPPRRHRAGRYYTGASSPGRYDPRDSFAHPYDTRGRPSERDWRRVRTPRYDRGRRYSSEYRRPKHHDPYPPSRGYHSVSSERRSPGDSRRGRDSPSGTQFPRDVSVSTGRSPTPVPRRESGPPPVSSAIRREGPTDMTPPPTHRPLESPEHEPVIIKVPSRSEPALPRPPSIGEEIRAHTPAVTHVGTLPDREEESERPMRPVRDSVEDRRHPSSTFDEGSRRPVSSHRVPYDSRLPSLSSDGEGPRQSPHPEVHRVHDDSPVAGSPIPVPTPTQPTTAERPASIHEPREATATPLDLGTADDDRGRLEALNDVAERLHSALITAQNAEEQREVEFLAQEDRREDEFRRHEGDRQHYFEEGEGRRDAEARQRSDGIWQELETRLKALPAPTPVPQSPSRPVSAADADDISSIRDLVQQAASQHASDVMETISLEREDAAREREALAAERAQLVADISAQKDAIISEKDGHIATLEDELARVRAELEAERQQRGIEDSEMRERERQELIERDENIRAQLGDITNLVQDQRDMCEAKKALMDARWEQKEARREDKNAQMIELRDMVLKIHDDMERDRSKCEDERRETQEGLQKIIEELRAENFQQRELLTNLSESWRADCERHHQETLETVRSTANEQVSFNVQGYLDDFSRALATEVRMLLGEVGRIREERRALQHEIGELLCMKSKYGPGGEFEPDWTPPGQPPGPQPPTDPPIPPIPDSTDPPIVRPAWRVHYPRKKKKKEPKAPVPTTSVQPPQAGPSHMDRHLRQQVASWSTWRPDPDAVMTPPSVEPTLMVPDRLSPGLFGARTPTSSMYDEPGPQRRR